MCRILLVDDDPQFRTMLHKVLVRAGHDVHDAAEGQAALDAFTDHSVDLVITDLVMPGKEGLETIVELRRTYPSVKIIAISGGGRSDPRDYLAMARRLGAHESLVKPFSGQEILSAIDALMVAP